MQTNKTIEITSTHQALIDLSQLTKFRLSVSVVVSSIVGYFLAIDKNSSDEDIRELRKGWTTGACAAAAARAAYQALLTGHFPDPVEIVLPKGQRPAFALAETHQSESVAMAAIKKDAGDDDAAALMKKAEAEDVCVPIGEGENCW